MYERIVLTDRRIETRRGANECIANEMRSGGTGLSNHSRTGIGTRLNEKTRVRATVRARRGMHCRRSCMSLELQRTLDALDAAEETDGRYRSDTTFMSHPVSSTPHDRFRSLSDLHPFHLSHQQALIRT
jgi:hypothetical protein